MRKNIRKVNARIPRGPKPAARWVMCRHGLTYADWQDLFADLTNIYRAAFHEGRMAGLDEAARIVEHSMGLPQLRMVGHGLAVTVRQAKKEVPR